MSFKNTLHFGVLILKKEYRKNRVLDLLLSVIIIGIALYLRSFVPLPFLFLLLPLRFLNNFWNTENEKLFFVIFAQKKLKPIVGINKIILFLEMNLTYCLLAIFIGFYLTDFLIFNTHLLFFMVISDYFFYLKPFKNSTNNMIFKFSCIAFLAVLFSTILLLIVYYKINYSFIILTFILLIILQYFNLKYFFNERKTQITS